MRYPRTTARTAELHRVMAAPAARDALARLRAVYGPMALVESAGRFGSGSVLCLPAKRLARMADERVLDVVDHAPIYIKARYDDAMGHQQFTLTVEPGEPEALSLPAGAGLRFALRPCAAGLAR